MSHPLRWCGMARDFHSFGAVSNNRGNTSFGLGGEIFFNTGT
ncbi:hypothetical protein TRICHSKD4_5562 [Roseibium sp. TrichSKD4]|nr:hypothetical protein TRICHSKD4_5562 [Roseibium sp. TrichSKD4]